MKPTKIIVTLAFFCGSILTCTAQTAEKVTIQSDLGYGIYSLVYKTPVPENVKVLILNDKGDVIFKESLAKTMSFSRPYNFSDQPAGEFTIVVEDKDGKTERKIMYAIKKVGSSVDVSRIANASNKYLLVIDNKEADQIQVKIVDKGKNVVYEESIMVNGRYAVVYNLDKLNTAPTFEVASSDGIWKTFSFQ
jgi:hypothetical protein